MHSLINSNSPSILCLTFTTSFTTVNFYTQIISKCSNSNDLIPIWKKCSNEPLLFPTSQIIVPAPNVILRWPLSAAVKLHKSEKLPGNKINQKNKTFIQPNS